MSQKADNDNLVKFVYMNCGGSQFTPARGGRSLEEDFGAPCANCGTLLTQENVKQQAMKMAGDTARRAFGEGGFKLKL